MPNPYTRVTISNYNANPPPDDGSNTPANQLNWSKHKTKLADPLKTAIETIDQNIANAFDSTSELLGPGSSTNTALARWDGTGGNRFLDSSITSDGTSLTGVANLSVDTITPTTGGALRTAALAGNTLLLQARDVDGASYTTFITFTANNTPTCDLDESVTKSGGYIYRAGGTDIPITDGGTGASTVEDARSNLGLTVGSDVQAWSENLDELAALSGEGLPYLTTDYGWVMGAALRDLADVGTAVPALGSLLSGDGGTWQSIEVGDDNAILVGDSAAEFGLSWVSGDAARTALGLSIGSDVQAWDDDLDELAALSGDGVPYRSSVYGWQLGAALRDLEDVGTAIPSKGAVLVGDGSAWQYIGPGSDGQFLRSQSSEIYGLDWASVPGGGDLLSTNNLSDVASASTSLANLGGIGPQLGYIYGLTLSNNATDATNDIDIAVGRATDDGGAVVMVLGSAITKRLDAAWAVGTGNGGLDTGTIADTTYHVWLIRRSDTGVVDALFSTSATSPTMPTSYDQKRRIGSILRGAGTIAPFTQDGDYFTRSAAALPVNATDPGTSAVTATLAGVPAGIRVRAVITFRLQSTTTPSAVYISDLDASDQAPSTTGAPLVQTHGNSSQSGAGQIEVRTNTSTQIRYRLTASDGNTLFRIAVLGWKDRRGRDG